MRSELLDVYQLLKSFDKDVLALIDLKRSNYFKILNKTVKSKGMKISYNQLYTNAYREAFNGYNEFLKKIRKDISIDIEAHNLYYNLKKIGFTGYNLKLKLTLLTEWWAKLKKLTHRAAINMADKETRQVVKKLLSHIQSLMESLKHIFPGLEIIIEYIGAITSGIDAMDELNLI